MGTSNYSDEFKRDAVKQSRELTSGPCKLPKTPNQNRTA